MASGFATVSGTTLAAYIKFGAEPSHMITSSGNAYLNSEGRVIRH